MLETRIPSRIRRAFDEAGSADVATRPRQRGVGAARCTVRRRHLQPRRWTARLPPFLTVCLSSKAIRTAIHAHTQRCELAKSRITKRNDTIRNEPERTHRALTRDGVVSTRFGNRGCGETEHDADYVTIWILDIIRDSRLVLLVILSTLLGTVLIGHL